MNGSLYVCELANVAFIIILHNKLKGFIINTGSVYGIIKYNQCKAKTQILRLLVDNFCSISVMQ